jgi:hypothetical protein
VPRRPKKSWRYGADAHCGVGNISYISSMIYGWMGDVFGQRRSFSSIGLRHHQTA